MKEATSSQIRNKKQGNEGAEGGGGVGREGGEREETMGGGYAGKGYCTTGRLLHTREVYYYLAYNATSHDLP